MNGPEHYREAERLVALAESTDWHTEVEPYRDPALAAAQVHATLAQVAMTFDATYTHVATTGPSEWLEAMA